MGLNEQVREKVLQELTVKPRQPGIKDLFAFNETLPALEVLTVITFVTRNTKFPAEMNKLEEDTPCENVTVVPEEDIELKLTSCDFVAVTRHVPVAEAVNESPLTVQEALPEATE